MHNTAVEDLFLREETIENSAVCNVKGTYTCTALSALTHSTAENGKIYRVADAGTVGGVAVVAGDFLKASIASTTLTWAKAVSTDIKGYKQSDVRDWKRWGRDHSKDLGIAAWAVNGDKLAAGAATIVLESSADGTTWTEIASASGSASAIDKNGRLAFFLLPRSGIKQYVRVVVKVTTQFTDGTNALAPVLSVGLENDAEQDIDATMVQGKIG